MLSDALSSVCCPEHGWWCRTDEKGAYCPLYGCRVLEADAPIPPSPEPEPPPPPPPPTPRFIAEAAVEFGVVTAVTVAERGVKLHRSGVTPFDIAVTSTTPPWLDVDLSSSSVLFRIDAGRWDGVRTASFSQVVALHERATNARAEVTLGGTFAVPILAPIPRELHFETARKSAEPQTMPMRVRNVGDGDLVIREVVWDREWLQVSPSYAADGDGVELHVTAYAHTARVGQHEGKIRIATNDRLNPEVSITVLFRVKR